MTLTMVKYFKKVQAMLTQKDRVINITKVPWEDNTQVDFLSELASANLIELPIDV